MSGPMSEIGAIVVRLALATGIGAIIGVNRDLHGQAIGLRTLAVVGLGAAAAVLLCADLSPDGAAPHADAISRVLQGILTGVGFLGAGVILRTQDGAHVHGLTTAATIWMTAVIGVACGLGAYRVVGVTAAFSLLILTVGGRIEKLLHRLFVVDPPKPPGG